MHCNDVELRYFSRLSGRALILCLAAYASAMLNSISRLRETRPEQEWSNGTEFSGYSDFPEKRVHSKRILKFSKTFPGIFTVPFSFGPEISEILAEWKAPQQESGFNHILNQSEAPLAGDRQFEIHNGWMRSLLSSPPPPRFIFCALSNFRAAKTRSLADPCFLSLKTHRNACYAG